MIKIKEFISKNKLILSLLCAIILPILLNPILPHVAKEFFYSVSVSMKQMITVILPFIIFSFIVNSLINIGKKAIFVILLLFIAIYFSNLTAILLGFYYGSAALNFIPLEHIKMVNFDSDLNILWNLNLTPVITNEIALITGLTTGFVMNFIRFDRAKKTMNKLNDYSLFFLKRCFLPVLPLFIFGSIIKLDHDNIIDKISTVFGSAVFVILSLQIMYTFFIYLVAHAFNLKNTMVAFRNMLPATFTAFTTISSAAAIPVNIVCTEKNVKNPSVARTIIPITANIHTLGSAIGLTILSTFIMYTFGFNIPSSEVFLKFAMFFAMSKFAVAGIPGGVVLVISPLLETYLGFSAEMIGLITSLYILLDPIGTSVNVTCNGGFAIIISKITGVFDTEKTDHRIAHRSASSKA